MTDIQLHYREKGSGLPLILLHGNGENGNYFEHQIAYFSRNYRVIAVDTRGHGKSPRGTAPFTISQFAEDLNAFLEEWKIERAVLLGFSDGANIAMRFAMKHQEKLLALILDGGNLDARGVKRSIQLPITLGYRMSKLFSGLSAKAEVIHVPTLVLAGTKDLILEEETRRIAEHIPGAKLRLIEGDHFIAAKAYEAFNAAVEEFLNGISGTKAHSGEAAHGA